MPKSKFKLKQKPSSVSREQLRSVILNQLYNLYMNNYEFEGDIDYQQQEYILKRFWADGQIACFKLAESQTASHPQGLAVFVPFAPGYWNIYDWPVKVNLINTRGVKFIPVGLQDVDKDVVIGYAQRNKKPIRWIAEHYADRMTDILMTIEINKNAHKMPFLVGGTPEAQDKLRDIMNSLLGDEPTLFIDDEDIDKFKALVSGAPYIIDKLFDYYTALKNEIREFFGFSNIGVNEKKEHLINEEVKANNGIIEANKNCLLDPINEFFQRVKDVLGIDIKIKVKEVEEMESTEDYNEEVEEVEDQYE